MINHLEAVDLPIVEEHSEYDITNVYEDYRQLLNYMKTIIKVGKITTYKNTDSTIQYRGTTIPLYTFTTSQIFKKNDIYAGINKEVTTENIVCRIMPITCNNSVKWIGIYLKSAL